MSVVRAGIRLSVLLCEHDEKEPRPQLAKHRRQCVADRFPRLQKTAILKPNLHEIVGIYSDERNLGRSSFPFTNGNFLSRDTSG